MSLINRMLQDLDARGGQPGQAAVSPEIKTVMAPERGLPWLRVALLGALAVVLGGSAFAAWRLQGAAPVPVAPAQAPVVSNAPVLVAAPAPAPELAPAPAAAIVEPVAPVVEKIAEPVAAAPQPQPVQPAVEEAPKEAAPPATKKEAPARRRETPSAEPATMKAAAPAKAATRQPTPEKTGGGRVETTAQRAENGYRRALASLEDGRVSEAIGLLEGALRADPKHEAARQTLVSLLVEAKRPDDAMRQLQAALALDPRQPSMAMLLARLQIEHGGPGIDTLLRTLPYAAGNGDYHAFLAGALQREQRHREAAEHYTAALRTAPQNGVWWMGLGMSLQAEKRNAEAVEAFQKAKASGTLSAELMAFVDRKLKQFAR